MKTIKVSREKAIIIASNHNNIPLEKAKTYTDSELKEVLRHLNLKPGFYPNLRTSKNKRPLNQIPQPPQNKYKYKNQYTII